MKFDYYIKSEIGIVRQSNQDSAFAGTIRTRQGKSFFGIVCDGMGGLSEGEYASRTIVNLFADWYINDFRKIADRADLFGEIRTQWSELMSKARDAFIMHEEKSNSSMGTTLSALLIAGGKYYAAQVGDSRIYLYRDGSAVQITSDHSYVAELAEKGLMTYDEANVAPNKNILTRCIGNMCEFSPDFYSGEVLEGDCFSISSDGFHGGIIASEMNRILEDIFSSNGRKMRHSLDEKVSEKMKMGEKDNITAICVKTT
ncbi:MAG: PP2C family protein-serine/threonine phosphatase [Oscillospiraceae bacterium]